MGERVTFVTLSLGLGIDCAVSDLHEKASVVIFGKPLCQICAISALTRKSLLSTEWSGQPWAIKIDAELRHGLDREKVLRRIRALIAGGV